MILYLFVFFFYLFVVICWNFSPGIGQGRVTSNLNGAPIDDAVFVSDKEAVEMVRQLDWFISLFTQITPLFINFYQVAEILDAFWCVQSLPFILPIDSLPS